MKKIIYLLLFISVSAHASWFDTGNSRPASFADLAKKVKPAVVSIQTSKKTKRPGGGFPFPQSPFGQGDPFEEFRKFFEDSQPREETRHSLGSGFIINAEGDILTNNHVVGDADEIVVVLVDSRKFKAKVVGRDERTDLAVIKIQAKESLPFAKLGDSDKSQPGDWVMAVGNPFGFEHTVTVGVVSAKGRLIGDANAPMAKFIQTDASINPGNSGGPLFDLDGEVIGINTMIYGMGTGIGFAIPINLAKSLVPQLIAKGKVTRGWLGVQIQRLTPELAESYGLETEKGALIGSVFPDSPAEKAGIQRGDIVLTFDGKPIEDPFDLSAFVAEMPAGKEVTFKILREGKKEITITAKIGERQEEGAVAKTEEGQKSTTSDLLGLSVRDLSPNEARRSGEGGVVIQRVEPGSPTENQDLREGDILYEINGEAVKTVEDYRRLVGELKKGSLVRLLIGRGNMTIFVAFRI